MPTEKHPPPRPQDKLPTLQRNALRILFDRPDFSPEEVAALGYKRLQKAEGVGDKGLAAILAWLNEHGYVLEPACSKTHHRRGEKDMRLLQRALRVLDAHGFDAVPRSAKESKAGQ